MKIDSSPNVSSRFKPLSLFWSSLSLLERVTFIATLLFLLVLLAGVGGLIEVRSLTGLLAGALLILSSTVCLICVSCLIVGHLLRWRRIGAGSLAVLAGGLAGAFVAASLAIQIAQH